MCPSELNVRSLRIVDRSQNALGIAMQMWVTFSLGFRSKAFIIFDLFNFLKLNKMIFHQRFELRKKLHYFNFKEQNN